MDEQPPLTESDWLARERHWERRLSRLRLDEPLDAQLARFRQVTWVLTAIPCGMGLIIVAIFTAFWWPLMGLLIACVLVLPIVGLAWTDYLRLVRLAAEYQRERAEFLARRPRRS
jgi:hypothetical protein